MFTELNTKYLDSHTMRQMRSMAAALIPTLTWRHNGQGMLQAYMHEDTGNGYEARLHIWHPSLRLPGIEDNGLIHDHRFDMRVMVLAGSIGHTEWVIQNVKHEPPLNVARIVEVLHARAAMGDGGSFHKDPDYLDDLSERIGYRSALRVTLTMGQGYYFPKRIFHNSFGTELAVTLVEKFNQEETPPARLLDTGNGPLINSFENTLPGPHEFKFYLDDATRLLKQIND